MNEASADVFPQSMKLIVAAIGPAATIALAKAYGGAKVWIPMPSKLVEAHPLAQLLGIDVAVELSKVAGGYRLQVPLCQSVQDAIDDQDMLRRWRDDQSAAQIARAHQTTERTVLRRLARLRLAEKP